MSYNDLIEGSNILNKINTLRIEWGAIKPVISRGQRGVIISAMNNILGGDEYRRLVMAYIGSDGEELEIKGKFSSNELDEGIWYALYKMSGVHKDETDGRWEYSLDFSSDCIKLLTSAMQWYKNLDVDDRLTYLPGISSVDVTISAVVDNGGIITKIDSHKIKVPKEKANTADLQFFKYRVKK